jgi:alpha-glucosidase
MKLYRDFTNDPETHPYSEGEEFMEKLNSGGRHWIPIVDAAIYIPNPDDPADA